jgi:hypothetical protein
VLAGVDYHRCWTQKADNFRELDRLRTRPDDHYDRLWRKLPFEALPLLESAVRGGAELSRRIEESCHLLATAGSRPLGHR